MPIKDTKAVPSPGGVGVGESNAHPGLAAGGGVTAQPAGTASEGGVPAQPAGPASDGKSLVVGAGEGISPEGKNKCPPCVCPKQTEASQGSPPTPVSPSGTGANGPSGSTGEGPPPAPAVSSSGTGANGPSGSTGQGSPPAPVSPSGTGANGPSGSTGQGPPPAPVSPSNTGEKESSGNTSAALSSEISGQGASQGEMGEGKIAQEELRPPFVESMLTYTEAFDKDIKMLCCFVTAAQDCHGQKCSPSIKFYYK